MDCRPSFIKCQGSPNTLHSTKMRISLRGTYIERFCADPRTQRESFPGKQKCVHIHQFRALSQLLSSWTEGFCGEQDASPLLEESRLSWLSWPGIPAVHRQSFSQMGQKDGGWSEVRGGLNPAQESYYPLARLQISGLWKQMVLSATQITEGRFKGEVNHAYLFANRWTGSPLITQLKDTLSITHI